MEEINKKLNRKKVIFGIVIIVVILIIYVLSYFGNSTTDSYPTADYGKLAQEGVLSDLQNSNEKVKLGKTELVMYPHEQKHFYVGIKNEKSDTLYYKIGINIILISSNQTATRVSQEEKNWFEYPKESVYSLKAFSSEVRELNINVPSDTKVGTYLFELNISNVNAAAGKNLYDSKEFFITVIES